MGPSSVQRPPSLPGPQAGHTHPPPPPPRLTLEHTFSPAQSPPPWVPTTEAPSASNTRSSLPACWAPSTQVSEGAEWTPGAASHTARLWGPGLDLTLESSPFAHSLRLSSGWLARRRGSPPTLGSLNSPGPPSDDPAPGPVTDGPLSPAAFLVTLVTTL